MRLSDMGEPERSRLWNLACPTFESEPWVAGPPLKERRVAMISTAGLHRRDDRPFELNAADYRVIPGSVAADELIITHASTNFDRSGFQQDPNVMLPLDRLRELAAEGTIGAMADFHYSFMGATAPEAMEPTARHLAALLKRDAVDAVLLVPV